ncbi:MAG TPA: two-component regulator propeller domain-containing protein [Anaerolineae bacterium]|nr:two-component regulator propeller domain-containing protein [Anaerolineae bacterium]
MVRLWRFRQLALLSVLAVMIAGDARCPSCALEVKTSTAVLPAPALSSPSEADGGRITTEALALIGASEYHAAGYRGAGVKVAVIDEAFTGLADRIAGGELPANVVTRRFTAGGGAVETLEEDGEGHGAACAEIIYDIAPEAQLYLVQVDSLIATLEAVLDYLRQEGVRVVSISMSTLSPGRGDGSGRTAESATPLYPLLDAARDAGMLIVKSAGNYAQQHYRGEFSDADGDGWHEFGRSRMGIVEETLPVQLHQGKTVNLTLAWDDWGDDPLRPVASATYELYLFDRQGVEVARSVAPRAGISAPAQRITFTSTFDGVYTIRIRRSEPGSPSHMLEVFAIGEDAALTAHVTPAGSLGLPGDARSVLTVGAVNVSTGRLVPYSSRGPTADGRIKPDLSSYSFVSVATPDYGPYGFSGTSAAAPHVAGMAAVLLSAPGQANLSVAELEARLRAAARDQGTPGMDPLWGAGIAQLPPLGLSLQLADEAAASSLRPGDPRRRFIKVFVERSDGSPLPGLLPAQFEVEIGGRAAPVLTARNLGRTYVLEVALPSGLPAGSHAVVVSALGQSARAEAAITVPAERPALPTAPTLDVSLSNATPRLGEPVLFLASVAGRLPDDAKVRVVALIEHPDGATDGLTFHDDGLHGDGLADDGVYGGWYARVTAPGRYPVRIMALTDALAPPPRESQVELALKADAALTDADGDGLPDVWEQTFGTRSRINDAGRDPDNDGLTNLEEFLRGADPLDWDSDGDGLTDGDEVGGYFQTSPCNSDTDLGGADDGDELQRGTHPLDPADDGRESPPVFLPLQLRPFNSRPRPLNHARDGETLWLATDGGVVRWDIAARTYVRLTSAQGLIHDTVYAIQPDATGAVWIGTQGGVSRYEGASWRNFGTAQGLPHPIVRALTLTPDGALWAATALGAARLEGARWQAAGGAPVTDLYAIAADGKGRIWVGGANGAAVLEGGRWRALPALADTWVTAIVADAAGRLWFGTWGAGVAMLQDPASSEATWITHTEGLSDDFVLTLMQTADGVLWARTRDGISSFDGDGWTTYVSDVTILRQVRYPATITEAVHRWFGARPLAELPPELFLVMTAEQRPWFGNTRSLQNTSGTWQQYQTIEGLATPALTLDAEGRLWVAAASSLSVLEGQRWAMVTPFEGLPERDIMALAADVHGAVWAGSDGGGALKVTSQGWTRYEVQDGLVSSFIYAVTVAPDGSVWFGSGGGRIGVSRLRPDRETWATFSRSDVLGGHSVRALVADTQGAVWVGSEGGVARFANGVWDPPIATAAPVTAVEVDPAGKLWIGTAAGLAYLEGDDWTIVEIPAARGTLAVRDLLSAPDGRLWCATDDGVRAFDPQTGGWSSLTTAEGLLSNDVLGIARSADGQFWFATAAGLSAWTAPAQ